MQIWVFDPLFHLCLAPMPYVPVSQNQYSSFPYLHDIIYGCSSSWQVTIKFDTFIYDIAPDGGASAICHFLSNTCSFSNGPWNGAQNQGESFAVGVTITFSSPIQGTNPNVVSITLNGQLICKASNATNSTESPYAGAQISLLTKYFY